MAGGKTVIVSVVRDPEMYSRCVSDNLFCEGCKLVCYDNSQENVSVTDRYNSFLDSINDECWIVFCHEDWQVMENLPELLSGLDRNYIYGPVGAYLQRRLRNDYIIFKGSVREGYKDGSLGKLIKFSLPAGRVDTIDCQCIIVHSSLIKRFGLRFDSNLLFDMYAEDFSASAFVRYGIKTAVVPIKCIHYSPGKISDSFLSSLEYVRDKYRGSAKRFATIVGYKTTFGGDGTRPVHRTRFPRLAELLDGE